MSDLTLPATIPGLVQRGTQVLLAVRRPNPNEPDRFDEPWTEVGTVTQRYPDGERHVSWWNLDHSQREKPTDIVVDLTDRTSRVHAAWWAWSTFARPAANITEREILHMASNGHDMTDEQIATLRGLVLRLHEEKRDA